MKLYRKHGVQRGVVDSGWRLPPVLFLAMLAVMAEMGSSAVEWSLLPEKLPRSNSIEMNYGNGVLMARRGGTTRYSEDGLFWKTPTPLYVVENFAFGGGRFVAVDSFGSLETTDGSVWVRLAWDMPAESSPIGYGRGRFAVFGQNGTIAVLDGSDQWKPIAVDWSDVTAAEAFGRGKFVVSTYEELRTSADLSTWEIAYQQTVLTVRSIVYGGGRFVATGTSSAAVPLLVSTSGHTWTRHDRSNEEAPRAGLSYGSGLFAGGGPDGTLYTSTDGVNWTVTKLDTSSDFLEVEFAAGRFVAMAEDGTVARSEVVPPHVTSVSFRLKDSFRLPDGAMLLTVDAPYGQHVLVEASEDLTNWIAVARDPCDRGEFEVYDENAGAFGRRFYRARQVPPEVPDPLTVWTAGETVLEDGVSRGWSLEYGNGVFVAAGKGSAWFSTDGSNWQRSSTAPHRGVVFGNGTFVSWATGPMTTADGQTWALHQPQDLRAAGIGYGRGRFVALAHEPTTINPPPPRATWLATSTNGMNWATELIPDLITKDGITLYAKGRTVFWDNIKIISSENGMTWATGFELMPSIGEQRWLLAMAYGAGRFVAIGEDSVESPRWFQLNSEDGAHWTRRSTSEPVLGMTWANGMFLGGYGDLGDGNPRIYRSEDAVNWEVVARLPFAYASGFTFAEGRFYFVTDTGKIYRSGVMPPHVSEARVIPERTYPLPDGAMLVTVEAPYGREVVVESSADMVNWQEVGRDPCERGEFEIYEESPGPDPRFYRARQAAP